MQLLDLARLMRLPNVFTAVADILLGTLITRQLAPELFAEYGWLPFLGLMLASGCLYCAGMVWNDYCDLEQDRRERPFRPLPAGRIQRSTALVLGVTLLVAGVAAALLAKLQTEVPGWQPVWLALGLVVAILLYDAWLKRTVLGPLSMGACRFFNVLLGLSLLDPDLLGTATRLHLAGVVGIYIVGVTWFARREAQTSERRQLGGSVAVIAASLLLALLLPLHRSEGTVTPAYPFVLVGFGFLIGRRIAAAVQKPTPDRVQAAVKRMILGLILLDALLASVFVPLPWAAGMMLLLLPGWLLGKWIYST